MRKFLFAFMLALCVSIFPAVTHGATPTYTVQVNGVALKATEGQAFLSGATTYMPLNVIAQKMGDTVTWDKKKQTTVIKKKNKTTITVKANSTTATVNGKSVPFVTKTEKGKTVNAKVKSLYINNTLYVPVQFISNPKALNYLVKIEKGKGKTVIYVGKLPASSQPKKPTQPAKPTPKPSQPTGKVYPDGWVAPVLKSHWTTPDFHTNIKIFEKELGFGDGGISFSIPGQPDAIIVGNSIPGYEAYLKFAGWQNKSVYESYRIPVVAKELFKFYFEKDADRVFNYLDSGKIPKTFTANGRKVDVEFNVNEGYLYVKIGAKK